jgi:hypothetical protein
VYPIEFLNEPIKLFCEEQQKRAFSGYCFGEGEEKEWEEKLVHLIEAVSENNVYFSLFDDHLSPIDILNAFWLAKEQEYNRRVGTSTSHYLQLGWREWLSRYQLTNFLDKMEE